MPTGSAFNVYTDKPIFDEGERILLNAELYNDALDLVNTPDVKINLKSTLGKNFSYLFSRTGKSYSLDAGSLPAGEYSYAASTKLGSQLFTATGQVTVKALNLELRQSAANHHLLRAISTESGGEMIYPDQIKPAGKPYRKKTTI